MLTISPAPAIVTKPLLMIDFAPGDSPWYGYADQIKSVAFAHTGSGFVLSIGKHAFHGCINLTEITLPDILIEIRDSAFEGCTSLAEITLPDSLTTIGERAFESCTSLTNITLPDSLTSIRGYAFAYCKSLSEVTLPNRLTTIGFAAFLNCDSLTEITLPDGVTTIEGRTFYDCTGLTEVTLPGSLTAIEKVAFSNCTNLASITFTGDTPPIISWDAFTDCGITEIRVPAGAEDAYREMLSKAGLDRIEVKGGYSITVTATEGGTASASSDFAAEGEEVALTAVPDRGYRLKEWQVVSGGVTVDSGRFVMPAGAVTVKAVFEKEDEPPSHTHAWAGLEPEQHPPLARVPHGGLYNPIGQRKERLRRPHPRRMDCGPGGHQLRGGQ